MSINFKDTHWKSIIHYLTTSVLNIAWKLTIHYYTKIVFVKNITNISVFILVHRCLVTQLHLTLWLFGVIAWQATLSMEFFRLQWVAISSSTGFSPPRDWTCISCVFCISGRFFTCWDIGEVNRDDSVLTVFIFFATLKIITYMLFLKYSSP